MTLPLLAGDLGDAIASRDSATVSNFFSLTFSVLYLLRKLGSPGWSSNSSDYSSELGSSRVEEFVFRKKRTVVPSNHRLGGR